MFFVTGGGLERPLTQSLTNVIMDQVSGLLVVGTYWTIVPAKEIE